MECYETAFRPWISSAAGHIDELVIDEHEVITAEALIDITFCQIEPCSGNYEDPNSDIDLGLHDASKFGQRLYWSTGTQSLAC